MPRSRRLHLPVPSASSAEMWSEHGLFKRRELEAGGKKEKKEETKRKGEEERME